MNIIITIALVALTALIASRIAIVRTLNAVSALHLNHQLQRQADNATGTPIGVAVAREMGIQL